MGLLTKLKSLLGLEDDRSQVRRGETGVTIEREPSESAEPDVEVESAVKGVDTGPEESFESEVTPEQTAESTETEDTGVSAEETATVPETERRESDAEEATEPATADEEAEPTPADATEAEPEEPTAEGEPLDDIKGIGPAYAERLRDAGVADVAELAAADADRLAEETGLSAKRITTWIERAKAR